MFAIYSTFQNYGKHINQLIASFQTIRKVHVHVYFWHTLVNGLQHSATEITKTGQSNPFPFTEWHAIANIAKHKSVVYIESVRT